MAMDSLECHLSLIQSQELCSILECADYVGFSGINRSVLNGSGKGSGRLTFLHRKYLPWYKMYLMILQHRQCLRLMVKCRL